MPVVIVQETYGRKLPDLTLAAMTRVATSRRDATIRAPAGVVTRVVSKASWSPHILKLDEGWWDLAAIPILANL